MAEYIRRDEAVVAAEDYCDRGRHNNIPDKSSSLKSPWISVDDSLPKNTMRCLVARFDYVTDTFFIDILWFEHGVWWNRRFTGDFAVRFWMPLPDLPKEGLL